MFLHTGEWPISMSRAIERTGLPINRDKAFAFLRKIGAFDQDNYPSQELISKGYFTVDHERYTHSRSSFLPRVASPAGYEWFKDLMIKNLPEVALKSPRRKKRRPYSHY